MHRIQLAIFITLILVPGIASAQVTMPLPIGIQKGKWLTIDLNALPDDVDRFVSHLGANSLSLETTDPQLSINQLSSTTVKVRADIPGPHTATARLGSPDGNDTQIILTFVGYTINREELYSPKPISYQGLKELTQDTPLRAIAAIEMRPYVPGVRWDISMFAHRSTFKDGARSFTATTGIRTTTLGDRGWKIRFDPASKELVGRLEFLIIIPGREKSFCVRTRQVADPLAPLRRLFRRDAHINN
ncbi:MAG: hypothetical protein PF961_01595 [Planctomycetota bacterium]|jgi:hypothetical protein|nr:hypothetical protein [Planctomycetota bacterium]